MNGFSFWGDVVLALIQYMLSTCRENPTNRAIVSRKRRDIIAIDSRSVWFLSPRVRIGGICIVYSPEKGVGYFSPRVGKLGT
jgi:hypothetical protein